MKFKNIKRDDHATSAETKLAGDILAAYIDHHDEIPEGTRIVVVVSTGAESGRSGCAFDGYDSDERLMLDLSMVARAVDLGVEDHPADEPPKCCPRASRGDGEHDIGCRRGGEIH